jgi:arsenate reductase
MLSSRVPRKNCSAPPPGAAPAISTMTTTLYGIPNCDTVKKARDWLALHGHEVAFHDFKKQGLARATAAAWLEELDWEVLVNRKGTTWRKLSDERRAAVVDKASALELMLEAPSVIKRPVLAGVGAPSVGFSDEKYAALFTGQAPR